MIILLCLAAPGIFFLYMLMIMPRMKHPKAHYLTDYFYAHRGLHLSEAGIPENSIPAFRHAAAKGYGIEMDVQLTKDKVPVVFHDSTLYRMCGVHKKVCALTLEELKTYRLDGTPHQIPTLKEALSCIQGKVPLIIEYKLFLLKCRDCQLIHTPLENYDGVYCIESFNPLVLNWYRKNHPQIIRGQLATDGIQEEGGKHILLFFVLKNMMMNWLAKPDFIAYEWKYRKEFSMFLCRKLYKIPTIAWTIESRWQMDLCRKHYDTVIFEGFLPQHVPAVSSAGK